MLCDGNTWISPAHSVPKKKGAYSLCAMFPWNHFFITAWSVSESKHIMGVLQNIYIWVCVVCFAIQMGGLDILDRMSSTLETK